MTRFLMILPVSVALGACTLMPDSLRSTPAPAPATPPAAAPVAADTAGELAVPVAGGQSVASLDTVSAADKAAATAPAPVTDALGRTIASLGDPAQPGLWLKTPLVRQETPGRVVYAATGASVAVTLIPIEGPVTAGSRMSLSAFQALGAPLTGLPEIEVFTAS